MRSNLTVLVLGAGSSYKFRLPLGNGLRKIIADDLDIRFDDFGSRLKSGSAEIVEALRLLVQTADGKRGDINPHRQAAVQTASAMGISSSIDEYIERHRGDPLRADCAKLAIAKSIVQAERKSSIYVDPYGNHRGLPESAAESWLALFLRDLTRGLSTQELTSAFRNIYIVNFNYDRCVEHFVYYWLQQMYQIEEAEAAKIARNLRIFHPYGSLGKLAYQDASSNIPFGAEVSAHRLVQMAKRIRTYSEAKAEDTSLDYAHKQISEAKSLVFLGFGFLQQNLELLTLPPQFTRSTLRYYASTKDIPMPKWELSQTRIANACNVISSEGVFAENYDGDCEQFWNEYSEVLVQ